MKKLFTFLFALIAGIGIASSATSGKCGDNLTWNLSNGVLTISGTGDMHNYGWNNWMSIGAWVESPWYSNRNSIHTVIINDGATSIGEVAFFGCSSLTSVTIPNSVTGIEKEAFENCSSLTSVTIPNSVTGIGKEAFRGCSGLTSVIIGKGVRSILDNAFEGCTKLTSITIPNSVTYIGNYAFSDCSKLTSITIPNSVTSIGDNAFYGCSSLTSITIPNSVTYIGYKTFIDCSSLTSVTINSDAIVNEDYSSDYNLKNIFGSQVTKYIIGPTVNGIGKYAFYECAGLSSVTIGNSVTRIGDNAFKGCSKLSSVTIPNSVTSIGDNAFEGCTKLTSITIPNSVTSIGDNAFYGCSSLTSITIPNSVTSIGDNAFYGCSSLTSITIPNSVTSIGKEAFRDCSGLTSVTLTAASEKEFCKGQGNYLLCAAEVTCQRKIQINGTEVTEFTIPNGVTSIEDQTFYNCRHLTSVTIPNSVTSIGWHAFYGCSSLKSVHISNIAAWCQISFYTQYSNPLYYAKKLYLNGELVTDLVIPNSVPFIAGGAFMNCSSLTSVTIPNSVTTIGNYAFENCSSLTSVTIGNSVTSIREYAFYGCNKLYDVYCYASTPPTADQSSFANYNAFLHVPCDNQRIYLLDVLFGNFKYVECIGAEEVMTDGVTVAPGKNDAVFTWPTEGSAKSYTLEIKKDGMVFCTLTFNANGQLTGIAFMPRPDGSTPAKAATSVGAGYQFTVTGLDGASHYTYKLTTKDAANQVIASYTGEFSTEGFTALEDAVIPSLRVVDGAVVCDEPYTIYDMSGRDVTNQNGNLQGVYIVRTAKGAVKVVF